MKGQIKKTILIVASIVLAIVGAIFIVKMHNYTRTTTSIGSVDEKNNHVGEYVWYNPSSEFAHYGEIHRGTSQDGEQFFCGKYAGKLNNGGIWSRIGSETPIESSSQAKNYKLQWLLDNIYVPFGTNNKKNKDYYLINLIGKCHLNYTVDQIRGLDWYKIDQYAIWRFTPRSVSLPSIENVFGSGTIAEVYKAIVNTASQKDGYRRDNKIAEFKDANQNVKVNEDIDIFDNHLVITGITIENNNSGVVFESNNNYQFFYDRKCTKELEKYGGKYYILESGKKNVYIKVSSKPSSRTVSGKITYYDIKKSDIEWITTYGPNDPQPLIGIDKEIEKKEISYKRIYVEDSDHVFELYKRDNENNPVTSARFELTPNSNIGFSVDNGSTYSSAGVEIGTPNGKNSLKFKMNNNTATFTIKETKVDPAYHQIKTSINITVERSTTNNNIISNAYFSNNEKSIDVKLDNNKTTTLELEVKNNKVILRVVNPKKKFDLALRKVISKLTTKNAAGSPIEYDDYTKYDADARKKYSFYRMEYGNISDAVIWAKNNVAGGVHYYNNRKEPVKVKVGDTVVYDIHLYNEGTVDGWVNEVTDYLPTGLKLKTGSVINNKYGWHNIADGIIATNMSAKYLTANLSNDLADALAKRRGYNALFEKDSNQNDIYQSATMIQVECVVDTNAKGYLTNVAEITKYEDKDNIQATKLNDSDIDSIQNNVHDKSNTQITSQNDVDQYIKVYRGNHPINDDILFDDNGIRIVGTGYLGNEDDDDFETLYVENEGKYKLYLEKTEKNNYSDKISNITFNIKNGTSNRSKTTTSDGRIEIEANKNFSTIDTDIYTISEASVNGKSYHKIPGTFDIIVEKKDENGVYDVQDVRVVNADTSKNTLKEIDTEAISTEKKQRGVYRSYTCKDEANNEVYIDISWDHSNNTITVTMENKSIDTYKISFIKKDADGNNISGVPFTLQSEIGGVINKNENYVTNGQPVDLIDFDNEITPLEINESNYLQGDRYRITENANNIYDILDKQIVIGVHKKKDDTTGKFSIDFINCKLEDKNPVYTVRPGTPVNLTVKTKSGATVPLNIDINSAGTEVVVTLDNSKKGNFALNLTKVDNTGRELVGAKFNVSLYKSVNTSGNTVTKNPSALVKGPETLNLANIATGTLSYDITKADYEAAQNSPYYLWIEETQVPTGKKALQHDIVIPVQFTDNSNEPYKVDKTKINVGTAWAVLKSNGVKSALNEAISGATLSSTDGINVKLNVPNDNYQGKYNLLINKVDTENNAVSGVKFNLTTSNVTGIRNGEYTSDANGKVNLEKTAGGNVSQINIYNVNDRQEKAEPYSLAPSTGTSKDTWILEELGDANGEYQKLKDTLKLEVTKKEYANEETYKVENIKLISGTNSITASRGQTKEMDAVLADNVTKVKVSIELNEAGTISLKIQNKKLDGKYRISFAKQDQNGDRIANVKFNLSNNVNGTEKSQNNVATSAIQDIDLSDFDHIMSDISINQNNVDIVDTYHIEEQASSVYDVIKNPIELTVSKVTGSTQYQISTVKLKYNGNTTPVTLRNGTNTYNVNTVAGTTTLQIEKQNNYISITLKNDVKPGNYQFYIKKQTIKEDNTVVDEPGVRFVVRNSSNALVFDETTKPNGKTGSATLPINEGNIGEDHQDTFYIKEVSATGDIVKLKNRLILHVTKGFDETSQRYEPVSVYIEEEGTTNKTTASIQNQVLSGVELLDGRTVDVNLNILNIDDTSATPQIEIVAKNRQTSGKLKLKLKKVNSATGSGVGSVKFSKNGQTTYDNTSVEYITQFVATADRQIGDIYFETENISDVASDGKLKDFLIKELSGAEEQGYIPLTDFAYNVAVYVKKSNNRYEIDVNKTKANSGPVDLVQKGEVTKSATYDIQKEIINKAALSVNNSYMEGSEIVPLIELKLENTPTTPYSFKLNKVDPDGNRLTGAKFKVQEVDANENVIATLNKDGTYLASNAAGEFLAEEINIVKSDAVAGKTYYYNMYEVEAPSTNWINPLSDGKHIHFTVVVDNNGNAKLTNGNSTSGVNKYVIHNESHNAVSSALDEVISHMRSGTNLVDKSGNSFTINFPNWQDTTDFKLKLFKHDEGYKALNAGFTVKRYVTSRVIDADIYSIFDAGTDSNIENLGVKHTRTSDTAESASLIDGMDTIAKGTCVYYELSEDDVPANYKRSYYKALVKVYAHSNGRVYSRVIGIKQTASSAWVKCTGSTDGNDSVHIDHIDQTSKTVTITWVNELDFNFKIVKKGVAAGTTDVPRDSNNKIDWNSMQPITATFTAKLAGRDLGIGTFTGTKTVTINDASASSTYNFDVRETGTTDGYVNEFEGMIIKLKVTTGADGAVKTAKVTNVVRANSNDTSISDADLSVAKTLVEAVVSDDGKTAELRVANRTTQPDTFDMYVFKQDTNGTPVQGVKFELTDTDMLIHNPGSTDENGITKVLSRYDITKAAGRYIIRETEAPAWVTPLTGNAITLSITSAEGYGHPITTQEELSHADFSVSMTRTTAEGLDPAMFGDKLKVEWDNRLKAVKVTIPNPSRKYGFNLEKIDTSGNTITEINSIKRAASFKIEKQNDDSTWKTIQDGRLTTGKFFDESAAVPSRTYRYRITETSTQRGYVNVFAGYYIYLALTTDVEGKISAANTRITFERIDSSVTPTYTVDQLRDYISVSTTDESTDSYVYTNIDLKMKNPNNYRFQLKKVDKNSQQYAGANITAERVNVTTPADAVSSTEILETLSRTGTNVSTTNPIIINAGEIQTWRIKEENPTKPYINVLENKYVVVQTKVVDGVVQYVHNDVADTDYWVFTTSGNDVTEQNKDYVSVDSNTNPIFYSPIFLVSIKDPIKVKVGFNKVVYDEKNAAHIYTPLGGATIYIQNKDGETIAPINHGSDSTSVTEEVGIGDRVSYSFTEDSSPENYINLFAGLRVKFNFVVDINSNGDVVLTEDASNPLDLYYVSDNTLLDKTTYSSEYERISKYVDVAYEETDSDGYPRADVFMMNDNAVKLLLMKKNSGSPLRDLAGTYITGEYKQYRYVSGTKEQINNSYFNNENLARKDFEFNQIKPGDELEFNISEIRTVVNSTYVNTFSKPITIKVHVTPTGTLDSENYEYTTIDDDGNVVNVRDYDKVKNYIGLYIGGGEGQPTIALTLMNPTQFRFEIAKYNSEDKTSVINGVNFETKLYNASSNTEYQTGNNGSYTTGDSSSGFNDGKITFEESPIPAGNYYYTIAETETVGNRQNIFKDEEGRQMYMKLPFKLEGNGNIVLQNPSYYYKDNDNDITNDQPTDYYTNQQFADYVTITKDESSSNHVNRILVDVINPFKFGLKLYKGVKDDGTDIPLANTEFDITVSKIIDSTTEEEVYNAVGQPTASNGTINVDLGYATPGLYKFTFIEVQTAENEFSETLSHYRIVVYVRLTDDGQIRIVSKTGDPFTGRYIKYIFYLEPTNPDYTSSNLYKYADSIRVGTADEGNVLNVNVYNLRKYNFKVTKSRYVNNTNTEFLDGANFTITKHTPGIEWNVQPVFDGILNVDNLYTEEDVELNKVMAYNISENSVPSPYINILSRGNVHGFVRIYTKLVKDGNEAKLVLTDRDGNESPNYFEVYNGNVNYLSAATQIDLDDEEYSYLKEYIHPEITKQDGVYTVNTNIINPLNIDIYAYKYRVADGENGKIPGDPINGAVFEIANKTIDEDKEDDIYTSYNGLAYHNESMIKPGSYTFKFTELSNPYENLVNVLEDKYLEIDTTIDKQGNVTYNAPYRAYSFDGTELTAEEKALVDKYIVGITTEGNKLIVRMTNPPTTTVLVDKYDLSGDEINGVDISIKKYKVGSETPYSEHQGYTRDGMYEVEEITDPGIYKVTMTELNSHKPKLINVLENVNAVVYIRVTPEGDMTLVTGPEGNAFDESVADNQKYTLEPIGGNTITTEQENIIRKYLQVRTYSTYNDTLYFRLVNPFKYEVDLVKKDQDGNFLTASHFSVRRNDDDVLSNVEVTSDVELPEKYLEPGDYDYYITEIDTQADKINILEGKFIKLSLRASADGNVSIITPNDGTGPNFEIYEGSNGNGFLLDYSANEALYNLITIGGPEDVNGVSRVTINVTNPDRNFKIKINKKVFGDEQLNIAGVKFNVTFDKVGDNVAGTTYANCVTDENGNLTITEDKIPSGLYKYTIQETATVGDEFINMLDDTRLAVYVNIAQDGSAKVVDRDGNDINQEINYYFEDAEGNDIPVSTSVTKNYIGEIKTTEMNSVIDTPELDVSIMNPEYYNFELVKADKDTAEKMNGVKFDVTVKDEEGNEVNLTNAETFEAINLSELETANVNGVDGVISIPKILMNKAGTYTFTLHEQEIPDELFSHIYKSLAEDITVNVEIEVIDGRYEVTESRVVLGSKYVTNVSTTEEKAQTTTADVVNERIKGKYDLIINKLDKYTLDKLQGAEFDITVEKDGEAYELYRATDDVNSKDVIIPTHVVVNGTITLNDIRIDRPETYTITLTETKAPENYMMLDAPIKIEVTTGRKGLHDDEEYVVEAMDIVEDGNHGIVEVSYGDHNITVDAKNEYFDLALRKSIESVSYEDETNDAEITAEETKNRVPDVVVDGLKNGTDTTAIYNHTKKPLTAYKSQFVTYTLRVYNEGEVDGYANEVTDFLPEELEYVDCELNRQYGWSYDENERKVTTRYLAENNEDEEDKNLIKAFNYETGVIDYKEIKIKCKISDKAEIRKIITNIAEITESKAKDRTSETIDRDSTTKNVKLPKSSEEWSAYKNDELDKEYVPGQEDDDDFEKLIVGEFDLALRKYIAEVDGVKLLKNGAKADVQDEDSIEYLRKPVVNASALKDGSSTTATYTHPKDPVDVTVGDIVTYTIRVYNEGTEDGYANIIKDDIPEGVEFVQYTEGDGSLNDKYRWKLVDENDKEVTDVSKAKYIVTDYLSKETEKTEGEHLLKAFDPDTMDEPDSKYVKVNFKVNCQEDYSKIITNYAQIADDRGKNGKPVKDRDSTPNEWKGEDDEDVEHIKVHYFDLALRKWVTKAIVTVNGNTSVVPTGHHAEDDPEDVVKVDLKKSKIKDVTVKFEYSIRVTNEGQIAGYAKELKDRIPHGLKFVQEDNPNWKEIESNIITTDALKDKLLQPGESAEVTVVLTWINGTDNMGVMTNVAEISKDYNDYGSPDIDSTPDNNVPGEDDIDDAPVMLTVKTGAVEVLQIAVMALGVLATLIVGVGFIKKASKNE